jgi:excinuclease ABC subunit B
LLISGLERDMKDFAKAMEFEKAAKVRDEISSLRQLLGTSDGMLGKEKRRLRRPAMRR